MATLKELIAQREALDKQIAETRNNEIGEAIKKVQALIAEFELTPKDVFPGTTEAKVRKSAGAKVPAKYRDPESAKTWTGRGKSPVWFDSANKEKFLIVQPS